MYNVDVEIANAFNSYFANIGQDLAIREVWKSKVGVILSFLYIFGN